MKNRLALIDIGTNTLRLVIAETGDTPGTVPGLSQGCPRFILQKVIATRLGESLSQNGEVSPGALQRTVSGVTSLLEIAREYQVTRPEAYATAWARQATNTDDVLTKLAGLNLPVWILTGDEEAAMGVEAIKLMDPSLENFWMIDVGGGSTEIVEVVKGEMKQAKSFPVGAITKELGVRTWDLGSANKDPNSQVLIPKSYFALGGTAACLAALKIKKVPEDPSFFNEAQGISLSTEWIGEELKILQQLTLDERKKLPGMEIERADILPAGTMILHSLLEKVQAAEVRICLYSFVHALLAKRLTF